MLEKKASQELKANRHRSSLNFMFKREKKMEIEVNNNTSDKTTNKTTDKTTENSTEISQAVSQADTPAEKTPAGQKSKWKKIIVVTAVLSVSVLLLLYFSTVFYYRNHFLPNTWINGMDFGNTSMEEAGMELENSIFHTYKLDITDRDDNILITIKSQDIDMYAVIEGGLDSILDSQKEYLWFMAFFSGYPQEFNLEYTVNYELQKVVDLLERSDIFSEKDTVEPENAYIGEYRADLTEYELIPEKEGTLLDKVLTLERVAAAIENQIPKLNLREAGCYKQAEVTADNKQLQTKLAKMNTMVSTKITYDWNGREEFLDGELIHTWIIDNGGSVSLDEEKVAEYVAEKAKAYDTYGKKRKFTTSLGVELTLPSGGYGWQTNRSAEKEALFDLIQEGAVTEREPEYSLTGYVKGSNDIGQSYVEIDMTNQHLYLYIDGQIILETDFVSGDVSKGNATPAGVFGITYKTKNAVLRGATYETPVTYWMPFNGNIGMHDASWRKSFGGEIYLTNGSHGCINLPKSKAAEIYGYMETKFPVICYYY